MERSKLLKYEGESVMLYYRNVKGSHSRAGVIKSVTMKIVIFWPMTEVDEKEIEIQIPFADIEGVKNLLLI